MSVLKGNRVHIRPIEKSDLYSLNEWKNTEEIYQNLGGGFLPVSKDIQEQWMDSLMDTTGKNKRFMMENENRQAIGMIGIYDINWIHRTCELGIFIGKLEEQGKGYGKEAYCLLENYARKYLNLRKIKAFVVSSNSSAVHMYEKLGFRKSGELVAERYINGEYHSVLLSEKILESVCGGGDS